MTKKPEKISQGIRFSLISGEWNTQELFTQAVNYRGDIQLTLSSGVQIEGYLFNYNSSPPDPFITLFPKNSAEKQKIFTREITEIYFSGRDFAAEQLWETWILKYKRREEARARGETDLEDISLYPRDLDKEN